MEPDPPREPDPSISPEEGERTAVPSPADDQAEKLKKWIVIGMRVTIGLGLAGALYEQQWLTAVVIAGAMLVTYLPSVFERKFDLSIPAEFELLLLLFIYASIFLGEVRDYYQRFWWWDVALHTISGLLLGLLGFLLVYVLNNSRNIEFHLKPRFVALFAFLFAVAMGALWEIFEFSMDQLFGANMQKPMLGDPSGLTDTMWDLIVDTLGAAIISCLGWWHMARRSESFIDVWIRKFIDRNPRLFSS